MDKKLTGKIKIKLYVIYFLVMFQKPIKNICDLMSGNEGCEWQYYTYYICTTPPSY